MSSRRKSRPVRRLDSIAAALHENAENVSAANDDKQSENSLSTPCESPQDLNQCVTSEGRESESEDEADNKGEASRELQNRKRHENPPEGVYILQPQGVSDDEGQEVIPKGQPYNAEERDSKKRQLEGESSDGFHDNGKREGLDLSIVKRRKTDLGGAELSDEQEHSLPASEATESDSQITVQDYQEKMKRYEKFIESLSKGRSLVETMQDVGLTQGDIASMHKFRMRLLGNSQSGFPISSREDAYQPITSASISSAWKAQLQNGAVDSWPAKSQFQVGASSQPQQKPAFSSSSGLSPAIAAAMMASLVSKSDLRGGENTPKSDVLQNLFQRSQNAFLKASPSSKSQPATVEYTTASADSMDTITSGTVSSGVGSIKKGTLDPTNFDEEVFDKYISKFNAKNPCLQASCPHVNRDHFHCTDSDCNFQRFTNKSDVIRHYNMHKKRDNSLAHGFMRFSPTDNCAPQFGTCHLNGKSTHYHCLHSSCTKVYTSTSDVMTHENFHKKNQHFVTNGFQRYRATETCDANYCPFRNQRTTHFHCTRKDCNFTFKNKCDIEKHKSYHMRDDAYTRQGFKKFYKNEPCQFPGCAWNRTANHFHCLRKNCDFSFTSTSQMVSHKRKHDRQDLIGSDRLSLSPVPSMVLGRTSSGQPKFEPSPFYKETARKVLASIPTSVATHALPQNLDKFSTKLEAQNLEAAFSSASPTSTFNVSESFRGRAESQSDAKLERPPPPYMEVPESLSGRNSPFEQNDRFLDDNDDSDQDPWSVKGQYNTQSPSNKNELQALNLSGRNEKVDEMSRSATSDADQIPSPAVLKFFRGLAPSECEVLNCVFHDRHHFHCVVQDCCAAFTDKALVITHTAFHDRLDKLGVKQSNSKHFPPLYAPVSRSVSSHDPNSPPPPGYIALPVTNRCKDGYMDRNFDAERRNIFLNRSDLDAESREDTYPQEAGDAEMKSTPFNATASQEGRSATLYDYISRIVTETKPVVSFPSTQTGHLGNSSSTAYVMLQNPSILSTVGESSRSSLSQIVNRDQDEAAKPYNANTSSTDGYVHFRPGVPCIRHEDCKYRFQNHWHCTLNRCRYVCKSVAKAQSHRQAHDSLEAYARAAKECFRSYTVKKNCPNPTCEFRLRGHYHCLKPGCQFVTIGTSKLPWHMKKHEKIARREASGFKYYTKKEQCGKLGCKYNGMFSHYHCIRVGCSFAFQYKHQMSTHVRKHLRRMLGRSYNNTDIITDLGDIDHSNVDSGDDSLPLIVDEADEIEQRPGASIERAQMSHFKQRSQVNPTSELSRQQLAVLEQISRGMKPETSSVSEAVENDGNRSPSVGANDSRDAPNEDDVEGGDISSNDEVLDLRATNNHESDSNSAASPSYMDYSEQAFGVGEGDSLSNDEPSVSRSVTQVEDSSSGFANKHVGQANETGAVFNKFRLNNDVMSGFKRYEITENCGDVDCMYSLKVSHYHCLHDGCSYRFTGRTHMFKHSQHHERVAGLVRDDFKRFKANQDCDLLDCPFNMKATHFHCLRCQFKCADSAKVGTHRRHHLKADTLEQSGFQRFRGKDDCGIENCKYRGRSTSHFHCLQPGCSYTVVGLSSIEQHFNKHKKTQSFQHNAQVNFSIFAKQLISQSDSANSSFADSSLMNSGLTTSYSVPFSALSSTPQATVRVNSSSSPVTDEQSSVPPSFSKSVVTPQFNSSFASEKPETSSVDISTSLNLSVNREMSGLQAGASL